MEKVDFEKLVAISGMSGIYIVAANRSNGLIVEDVDSGKRRFVSSRKHNFTPLASIGIYSAEDTTELKVVFRNMLAQLEENPPVEPNAKPEELHTYFGKVLPEYDRDKVYISDIKKVIKWFGFLNARNLISTEEEEAAAKAAEEAASEAEGKSAEPVVEKAKSEEEV